MYRFAFVGLGVCVCVCAYIIRYAHAIALPGVSPLSHTA